MNETIYLRSGADVLRFFAFLKRLTFATPWKVTLERVERRARVDQEAVLRGFERAICEHTGQDIPTIHDELLMMRWGVKEHVCRDGTVMRVPARRTRTGDNPLNESEMREHMRFVEAEARSMGVDL